MMVSAKPMDWICRRRRHHNSSLFMIQYSLHGSDLMLNTTLCYLQQDGKYLMLHRTKKENDLNHDKWVGVGGKFLRFYVRSMPHMDQDVQLSG